MFQEMTVMFPGLVTELGVSMIASFFFLFLFVKGNLYPRPSL